MAFGKGRVVTEPIIKRYIGVSTFNVEGINLTKEELTALYGREVTQDPVFLREAEINGVKVPAINIIFTLSTEINGEKRYFSARFPIFRYRQSNSSGDKVKVIDEYGRTAWVTEQELNDKDIPTFTNGNKANITNNYRPLYRGEEFLTMFFKAYLGIPNVDKWGEADGGKRVIIGLIDNPEDAESRLVNIENYFKGDISELKTLLSYQPANKIKLCLGVRKDDQNKLWQEFFIDMPMSVGVTNYTRLQKAIDEAKNSGKYANTTFYTGELVEYEEIPTNFVASETPASGSSDNTPQSFNWFNK